jgi:hypothetical protein
MYPVGEFQWSLVTEFCGRIFFVLYLPYEEDL